MGVRSKIGQPGSGFVRFAFRKMASRSVGRTGQNYSMTKQQTAALHQEGSGDPLGANSEIGRKLKQYYDQLITDEVPERFTQLLSQLEETEPLQKGKG